MSRRSLENILFATAVAVVAISPALLRAQAPPGPITGVAPVQPSQPAGQSPAAAKPQPRKTIAGAWRLNRDESSSPHAGDANGNGRNGGGGGNGPYGGGGGGNGPYGRRGGGTGFPFPGQGGGGGGPYGGGRGNGGGDPNQRRQAQQAMRPSDSLTVEQKENEVDLSDDRQNRTQLFTDGRKIQKPKNGDPVREVAAHWEGTQLVTDEKTPQGEKLSRTLESSPDGLQLIETIRMDTRRSSLPFTLRYVYDVKS
jgi:hypothetical protein